MGAQLATMELPFALAPSSFDSDDQIDALMLEAATVHEEIQVSSASCATLELSLAMLQSESDTLLSNGAEPAMDALLVLVERIEALYQCVQDQRVSALTSYRDPTSAFADIQARAPLVNACKSQSRIVFDHFRSLNEKARNLTQQFTELTTDFTFLITLAQERRERLQDMMKIADTLREGVERQRESWQGQKTVAELHIEKARETIRSAERKRDSRENARVVRNLLTFGIGEVFDFFDLNEEIKDAERTVASAEQNARACEQSIQQAMDALQRIRDEIACLGTLGDVVHVQEETLQACVVHGQALRTRTIDLTNASLEVSLFTGTLSARSETLATHCTAQEFAQGVLSFGRLMASEQRLNGLLTQCDAEALQGSLDMIAQSDGGTWESGRFIDATRPWVTIGDMM